MKPNLKQSAVKPTNNYVKPDLKENPVAPARKGFSPKTSSQLEQKNQFAGYKGYTSGKTGTPKNCDLKTEFGTEPKTKSAVGEKISDGTVAPKAKRNADLYAKSAGKSASGNGTY